MPHHHAPILIVDDDAVVRDLTREVLAEDGYDSLAVATHREAARALSTGRFALILSDSAGPWTPDPWPPLEAVRGAAGAVPVVIYSARAPHAFAGYSARGFAGHVAKPFNLDDLLATVRTALGGAA